MPSKPLSSPKNVTSIATEWSLLPCRLRALANQSYIFSQIISLQFYITTVKLRNNWSSRGFYSNFAAYGLKFLDDIHWPVHSECLCINSNNTVIWDALWNDKVEKSIANRGERNKGSGAGFERMAWGGLAYEREREGERAQICDVDSVMNSFNTVSRCIIFFCR